LISILTLSKALPPLEEKIRAKQRVAFLRRVESRNDSGTTQIVISYKKFNYEYHNNEVLPGGAFRLEKGGYLRD
jgi:hypothetical protein